ncbi:MFS transporter [Rhodococcus sp. ACPA4]|uniref:MFS transporter n=1 Tax=Rhodococcus TaxID=1827 RepID=UPI000BB108DB|nr:MULTISPECIES: MFS transporter [Rhodococcus]MCE4265785.1 MFS transporter [Rhodococcus globerulus]NRI69999.1 MFS transporter [Rhodococcus sp. MS16]PBC42939.1 MFS transporter [Rhodococcus sp. ACPA4]QXW05237.1 MFS transporter [Rhodococcus globerulus]
MTETTAENGSSPTMSRRQVNEAFAGILIGMLVGILSTSVVNTSLPRIVSDLHGDQSTLTWIVTGALLTTTVSTPIWGKLADLFNRRRLLQIALAIFIAGSLAAGFAHEPTLMIGARLIQGVGTGGLMALSQVAIADIISPRERGKYMGVLGAVVVTGTAGGPLLGGFVTDTVGWRWNFYLVIPVAVIAMIVIQLKLIVPTRRGATNIDYAGSILLIAAISTLLIWLSLGGKQFAWESLLSWCLGVGAVVLIVVTLIVESKVKNPVLPLHMFRQRTFTLAVVASVSVGIVIYSVSIFLSQYMQLSRGATATGAGLITLPQVACNLIASTVVGALISRTGKWKRWLITGASLLTVGVFLLSTLRVDTPFTVIFLATPLVGLGLGMLMQNLTLVVQNSASVLEIGAASSATTFFRSLGGVLAVTVFGAVLSTRVDTEIEQGLQQAGIARSASGLTDGNLPNLPALSDQVRNTVESAYGQGVGEVFLYSVPFAVIALICTIFMPNAVLGTKTGIQQLSDIVLDTASNDLDTVNVPRHSEKLGAEREMALAEYSGSGSDRVTSAASPPNTSSS